MSGSVGTMRAGSNKHTGPKDKMTKNDRNTHQQQQVVGKSEVQSSKMQPTQEQLRLAHDLMTSSQTDADPNTVKELMAMTGKSEDVVVIALHDAENDLDTAVMMLLEGGDDQGEWREQGGKKKKKGNTTQKDGSNHIGDDQFEPRQKDRGDREDKDRDGNDRGDAPPHRGRRNGGPPPRLSRGRGRDRANFGDRDRDNRDNRDRNNTDDWDNDREDRRDRSGGDRGRSRGRGGFGRRTGGGGGGGGGRGRFNNSNDRENRSYNRVPRFEKLNNSQPTDGPEIDTWTNETAETTNSKDTDWDNWNESWINEEDQWTGTLEETKVFTPSQMKIPEPEPIMSEPPSSLGQRLDVGSLFSESAKFSKAPDYSKPTGDAYVNQFNQAATESIKNTIGIGSSPRPPQSMSSMALPPPAAPTNSLGLSSLGTGPAGGGGGGSGQPASSVLSSLSQMPGLNSQLQVSRDQSSQLRDQSSQLRDQSSQLRDQSSQLRDQSSQLRDQSAQLRMPPVVQQPNLAGSQNNSLQQRPKPQRSKLPPPSKIPSTAVEMPGHIPQNPQLDLQFGIDFGAEPSSSSFGFVGASGESTVVTSSYSSANGTSSVISNHLPPPAHVSKPSSEGSSVVSSIMSSPSAGSTKVPSNLESQSSRQPTVFHNSVYNSSPPKNEAQSIEREQKLSAPDTIPFPSTQMERKSSPLMPSQRSGQNQNLSSGAGSMPPSKSDTSSNNIGNNYSSTNGYGSSSFPSQHQKGTSISQSQFNTHTTSSQPQGSSSYPGQYPPSQSAYPSSGQGQYSGSSSSNQYPPSGQPPQFNNAQAQYSSQNQFSGNSASQHPSMGGLANHQSQYSSGTQNTYSSSGQSQYQSYQNNASSFPSHPPSQSNYASSGQSTGGSSSSSLYPVTTPSSVSSYTSQSNTYQSPSAGGSTYHSRDNSQTSSTAVVSTQSSGVSFPSTAQSTSLNKSGSSQTGSNYNSQNFNSTPQPLQPSSLANKLGESLSKMTLKDTATLDGHQSSQFESHSSHSSHSSTSTTTVSASSLSSLSSTATTASLSTGTATISSTSTATSITSTSRIASMPLTSKAPPNLPPGVPLMGQYIMGQSTMPPFYSVQPPLYGYDDVQLLAQQRMPMQQAGSYYDMQAFPAPAGSTLPTAGRDQQPPIPPNVPFSGTSGDSSKIARVDAQSPSSAAQPQNAHSTAQPSLINYHFGYYYPSMFPGAAGLQYPMFPIPPVTNAAAHAGTTATTQFQKNYASHVYTTKGTASSEITPNAYNKSHNQRIISPPFQAFEKQGFHGGTPPPFNLPMAAAATATQAGPMGAPTAAPYGTPFLPMMAAHQAHNQMMHHQIQQDSNSSASRGMSQAGSQNKSGGSKSYGGPPYWAN